MAHSSSVTARPELGYNVIGYVTANLGLGVAARNTVSRLLERGADVRVIDIDPGHGRQGAEQTYASLTAVKPLPSPAVNVFHFNPPEVVAAWPHWRDEVDITSGLNACVPFWELPLFPPEWIAELAAMDVVLAPSLFILEACRACLPDTPAIHYPQTASLPEGVEPDRARWNIPADVTAFFTAFDINSDIERKNPWGAIEAFAQAFPGDEPVRLVVRLNAQSVSGRTNEQVEKLRARVGQDPRIVLLDEPLSYREVMTLYASCDVLVSLHRSEGLGLPLIEAMSLAKPVIATAWSGNMDFMDEDSACLVPYELVPVRSSLPLYAEAVVGPGQVWAEPGAGAAAEWMRRLAADPALRAAKGAAAREGIERHQRFAREHDPFALNESAWKRELGPAHAQRPQLARLQALLREESRKRAVWRVKRGVVLGLRRMGLYPPGD